MLNEYISSDCLCYQKKILNFKSLILTAQNFLKESYQAFERYYETTELDYSITKYKAKEIRECYKGLEVLTESITSILLYTTWLKEINIVTNREVSLPILTNVSKNQKRKTSDILSGLDEEEIEVILLAISDMLYDINVRSKLTRRQSEIAQSILLKYCR